MSYVLVKYLHIVAILFMFACLVVEHLLIKQNMNPKELRRLATIDLIYGVSAILTFIAGLLLWFGVGKPAQFYSASMFFHIKVTLFVVIGLLSIYPTKTFLSLRRSPEELVTLPKVIIMLVRVELLIMLVLPLFAVLMAQGFGQIR